MTTVNNFDKSSTGTDITATVFYDTDKSRMDFEENITILQHDGYRTTSVGYYTGFDAAKPDDIEWVLTGSDEDCIKWLASDSYWDEEELKGWDMSELRQEIIDRKSPNLIDYALEGSAWDEQNGFGTYDLSIKPNKTLIVLTSRGYSQGDYAKVIYCPEDLEKAWGRMPEQDEMQKTIDHLYWDAPIYASVEIDGVDYPVWEMDSYNDYEWDRDAFIAYVAKASGVSVETLEGIIPSEPSYN